MNIQINNNLERKAYCTEELASYVSFIGVGWDGVNFPSKVLIFVLLQELLMTKQHGLFTSTLEMDTICYYLI